MCAAITSCHKHCIKKFLNCSLVSFFCHQTMKLLYKLGKYQTILNLSATCICLHKGKEIAYRNTLWKTSIYFSNSGIFVDGRNKEKRVGKLEIDWIVCQSVIYLSGRTQGSEFWAHLLTVSLSLETFDSFGELLSSLEITNSKIFN